MLEVLAKYIIVALTAASPVGELFVALPLGVGLGLNALAVAGISVAANMLPALVISGLFWRAEQGTRVLRRLLRIRPPFLRTTARWLLRRRSRRIAAALNRWGVWGVLIVTPWAGVYAVTLTLEVAGMHRGRLLLAVAASLILYAILVTLVSVGLFRLFR